MKAVVLHEYGGPEKLKFEPDVLDPQISGDTVLIAAIAASVNPIDWKMRSGARQEESPLSVPAILGRDVSGVVRAIGANVKPFKPGESVIALSKCDLRRELIAVNDSDVTHLPDGVDSAEAAAIPLVVLTGDQLVRSMINVQSGTCCSDCCERWARVRACGSDAYGEEDMGAQVIAGVRAKELDEARSLGISGVLAIG